jgi:hypothetical protein
VPYTGDVTVGGPADVRTAGCLQVTKVATNPFENNCYLLRCSQTGDTLLVDAAGDAPVLLGLLGEDRLVGILETHDHWDHVQALAEVREATGAPVLAHPADAPGLPVPADRLVEDGDVVEVGACRVSIVSLQGHTPAASPCSSRATPSVRTCSPATACSRRSGQHREGPGPVRHAAGRPRAQGLRTAAGPDLGLPGARQGHDARRRAARACGVAGPGLVSDELRPPGRRLGPHRRGDRPPGGCARGRDSSAVDLVVASVLARELPPLQDAGGFVGFLRDALRADACAVEVLRTADDPAWDAVLAGLAPLPPLPLETAVRLGLVATGCSAAASRSTARLVRRRRPARGAILLGRPQGTAADLAGPGAGAPSVSSTSARRTACPRCSSPPRCPRTVGSSPSRRASRSGPCRSSSSRSTSRPG